MLDGQQVHAGHDGRHDDVVEVDVLLHQQVVDGQVHLVRVEAEADRQRALRVEVDEQDLAAVLHQRGTQVDGRRGLADAALLVAHRDDPGVAVGGQRPRLRDERHRPSGRAQLWLVGGSAAGASSSGSATGASRMASSSAGVGVGAGRLLLTALEGRCTASPWVSSWIRYRRRTSGGISGHSIPCVQESVGHPLFPFPMPVCSCLPSTVICRHGDMLGDAREDCRTVSRAPTRRPGLPPGTGLESVQNLWNAPRSGAQASLCLCSNLWTAGHAVGRASERRVDEVLVVRVLLDPAPDERAPRQHLPGAVGAHGVQGAARQRRPDPLALEGVERPRCG